MYATFNLSSQVVKSRVYSYRTYKVDSAITELVPTCVGGQTLKNMRRLAYEFELTTKVNAMAGQTKRSRTFRSRLKTCVRLCRLASPFD